MQEFKRPDIKWKRSTQMEEYKKATSCYICKESFTAENKKVRDEILKEILKKMKEEPVVAEKQDEGEEPTE